MERITEKPNYITPSIPYWVTETQVFDDTVERAFRLDAMRRKIVSAGLQPRQKYTKTMT